MIETSDELTTSIARFAAAVRSHLSDLSPEELEDLTGGLEADLHAQASDQDGHFDLNDAAAYAAELRAAAALPAKAATSRREPSWAHPIITLRSLRTRAADTLRRSALGAWVMELAVTLLPLWWVARGWVVAHVTTSLFVGASDTAFPTSFGPAVFMLAVILVSIQWGRGRWQAFPWIRGIRRATSILAVLCLPFVGLTVGQTDSGFEESSNEYPPYLGAGLTLDGMPISNIFAYDADGAPLREVQLYDQDGNALSATGLSPNPESTLYESSGESFVVPREGTPRGEGWNVYPLDQGRLDASGEPDTETHAPKLPYEQVSPLAKTSQTAQTPTPTPTPTPTKSAPPAATPTPSP